MKKILLGLSLFLVSMVAFVQAYLPRATDAKLIGLMLDNIELLIESKGDWVAEVAVDTMMSRMEWELDDRKQYLLGEVVDRLRIEYDIVSNINTKPSEKEDIIITEAEKMGKKIDNEQGEIHNDIVDTSSTVSQTKIIAPASVQQEVKKAVVVPKKEVKPTPVVPVSQPANMMKITMYWPKAGTCDDFVQVYRDVPRTTQYLTTTLQNLLSGPLASEGVRTTVDRPLKLLGVKLWNDIAFVDLPADFVQAATMSGCPAWTTVDMLNYTVMGVKGVNRVIYAVDGDVSAFYYGLSTTTIVDGSMSELQEAFDKVMMDG